LIFSSFFLPFKNSNSSPNSLLLNAPVFWGEVRGIKLLLQRSRGGRSPLIKNIEEEMKLIEKEEKADLENKGGVPMN
jgi:hypothetical protein